MGFDTKTCPAGGGPHWYRGLLLSATCNPPGGMEKLQGPGGVLGSQRPFSILDETIDGEATYKDYLDRNIIGREV